VSYDEPEYDRQLVRPYFLTQGRTDTNAQLPVEAMVGVARGAVPWDALTAEQTAIIRLCAQPIAIAEASSMLRLPLGVTRVLISDMVAAGLLETAAADQQFDDDFFDQMIAGVRRAAAASG
jgi:hypothetical protein